MPDPKISLPLIRGSVTLEAALEKEEDMLLELDYPDQRADFFLSIYQHREDVAKLVSRHLGLASSETCRLGDVNEWLHGSFNVCIPIYVAKQDQQPEKRAMIRFPLPYKIGESKFPGNVDEKLRSEAATYIWIHENCPDVPIPALWGFGLVGGKSVCKLIDHFPECGLTLKLRSSHSLRIFRGVLGLFGSSDDLYPGYSAILWPAHISVIAVQL